MKRMLLLVLLLAGVFLGYSQTKVSGTITNAKNEPMAGVLVKAGNNTVKTNKSGEYRITVPSSAKAISFSLGNYETKTVPFNGQTDVSVSLSEDNNALDELIVVAYGTAKKENFTGSASKIKGPDIANRTLTNPAGALIGAAPGLATTTANGQPGSTPAVRIRGFGSINASNEPLYVIDGVPSNVALSNINMDDIDNFSILKDAATTSLYGSRAANGVIMITTKKGKKGKNSVNVKYNRSITSRAIPDYDRASAEEFMPLMWEAYRNSLAYRATSPLSLTAASNQASGLVAGQNGIIDLLAYNAFNLPKNQVMLPDGSLNPAAQLIYKRDDLNWFDPLTRNGIRNEYSVNFSGGLDKTDYFVSAAYTKEEGYINRSDFERFNGRVNLNTQAKSWLKTGFNLAFTSSGGNFASTDGSNSIVNPFFFAARMGPIYPYLAYDPANPGNYLLDPNGNKQYDFGNATIAGLPTRPAGAYGGRHTIAENELSREFFKRNVFNGRAYAEIKFTDDLKFTTNYATDYTNRYDITYQNKVIGDGAPAGRSTKNYFTGIGTTFNQLLNYNKQFGNHNFSVLAGHENYQYKEDQLDGQRQGQVVDGIVQLSNFTTTTSLTSVENNQKIESYFGNIRYDFNNKYFFTLGARTDGNSRFSRENRWGKFWSASAAWVMSNEDFMKKASFINFLKLRSSIGTTGNDAGIGFYPYQTLYELGRNNGLTPGILQSGLGNNDLTWESNQQFDIAVDFELFKNRLSGTLEFFNRKSDNLLFSVPLPVSSGFLSVLRNVGTMYNRGVEIEIDATVLKKRDFTWKVGFNATSFRNKITKLPPGQTEIIAGTKKYMVGKSINDYWLREWYGVDVNDGAALFVPQNKLTAGGALLPNVRVNAKNDTVTTDVNNARFNYMGSAIPDWYGGLSTSFKYKAFTISILANWQIGGLTYDDTYAAYMHSGTYGASLHKDMLKRWRNPGDVTNVPRMDNAQTSIFGATSSRWLTKASFLNIQNITFSYDLSQQNILKKIDATNARFYISVENVRMFTKRSGMNPGQAFSGVTSIGYIPAQVFNLGLNINL
jgi:TonB-linked SusC/RagA family outer membrane protein